MGAGAKVADLEGSLNSLSTERGLRQVGHGPARLGAASSLGLGSRGACRAVLLTWEWGVGPH